MQLRQKTVKDVKLLFCSLLLHLKKVKPFTGSKCLLTDWLTYPNRYGCRGTFFRKSANYFFSQKLFCIQLINLSILKASSTPGGEEANDASLHFPNAGTPEFVDVKYNFAKFKSYTLAYSDFESETNRAMAPLKKIEENKKMEENDLKIDNFVNYCTEPLSDRQKCPKGSTGHGSG